MATIASSTFQRKCHPEDPRYDIDHSRKVFVYKNLHKGCWSIKQDGLVKMHITDLCMWDCSFRVSDKGRKKVLRENRKNVHAGITGYIDDHWNQKPNTKKAKYNPYHNESFVEVNTGEPVFWSSSVRLETAKCNTKKDEVHFVPCIPSANIVI